MACEALTRAAPLRHNLDRHDKSDHKDTEVRPEGHRHVASPTTRTQTQNGNSSITRRNPSPTKGTHVHVYQEGGVLRRRPDRHRGGHSSEREGIFSRRKTGQAEQPDNSVSYRHRVSCPVLGASRTTELSGCPTHDGKRAGDHGEGQGHPIRHRAARLDRAAASSHPGLDLRPEGPSSQRHDADRQQ